MAAPGDRKLDDFAHGFLPKPFKPETLLARVHELLRGSDRGGSGPPWRNAGMK
jgi:DNA-binding response OmpR family regulator